MEFATALLYLAFSGLVVLGKEENILTWREANDPRALCNDFTRAGFFLKRNLNSDKWIIFLESGSLCYSSETCNRRFFNEYVRRSENSVFMKSIDVDFPYGRFDPAVAYSNNANRGYSNFVNPLMTSMKCLNPSLFEANFSIYGRDIMDRDPMKNPDFFDHNHVIIPYCSSDLWLGDESKMPKECNCSDLECFDYEPNSASLQFTFRGKTIFQSIFRQLESEYGMSAPSELILAGSSAGGVGAINHAKWVRDQIQSTTKLLILFDSAWFINFQESIYRIFDGTINVMQSAMLSQTQKNNSLRLFSILQSHPSCSDFVFGYPCCISAHCVMTRRNNVGELAYYPERNQKTITIFSLYDVFLLAPALAGESDINTPVKDNPDGMNNDVNPTGQLINFLRIIGEYGGEMNITASLSFNELSFLSYYTTQCFQHVYLATSTLWGSIFSSEIELSSDLSSFKHSIRSGRWSELLSSNGTSLVTLQEAVSQWYHSDNTARYTESCQGPYCNHDNCPDTFALGTIKSNNWPREAKFLIILVIVMVPVFCIFMKLVFMMWLFRLERAQSAYLTLHYNLESTNESPSKFIECDERNKISVTCLDLSYSITYKITKKVKDETKDMTNAVVLHDFLDTLVVDQEEEDRELHKRKTTRWDSRVRQTFRIGGQPHHKKDPMEPMLHKHKTTRLGSRVRRTLFGGPHHKTDPMEPISEEAPPPTPEEKKKELQETIENENDDTFIRCFQEWTTKEILKGVSLYFNPSSMIAIMGPSGCGKTTFLDLLTGRRQNGISKGNIYINGFPLDDIREWYISNTGYVLQLATPYYGELTVRDNLTLAAQIMLSRKISMKDKLRRVELVMQVTGLRKLGDTVVGGEVGPGLSGGQKRRLAVGLQLLKLPSVIYLDEPTSGLDATSSMELLFYLDLLAKSGRTVILTIHQPRMEIFHMFDRLVLLSDGKVAYHGAPEKAYEIFVNALLSKQLKLSSLKDKNPADVIMDVLGHPKLRQIILEYYETLDEPVMVRRAVQDGINREKNTKNLLQMVLFGAEKFTESSSRIFVRLAALEARASKLGQVIFLPIMFFLFAFVLGTVYVQRIKPFLILSAMTVFGCASGLYVFPAIEPYFTPAIRIFGYEKANGVGQARDLVIQGFMRYITIAFLPVIVSTSLIYLLVVNSRAYSPLVYLQVLVVNISLNLTWTAMLIFFLMTFPTIAFRISSVVSSLAGFASGFFIPIGDIHFGYRWIVYLNPNYYGLSSAAVFLLENFNLCDGSQFECFYNSGPFILQMAFFDKVNPYIHLVVLLGFTAIFLCLAIFANWAQNTSIKAKFRRIDRAMKRLFDQIRSREKLPPAPMSEEKRSAIRAKWTKAIKEVISQNEGGMRTRTTSFLSDGQDSHKVWKPKYNLSDVVKQVMQHEPEHSTSRSLVCSPISLPTIKETKEEKQSSSVKSLQADFRRRQKTLMNRVNIAWQVLQQNESGKSDQLSVLKEDVVSEPTNQPVMSGSARWKAAAKRAANSLNKKKERTLYLSDLVSKLVAEQKAK